MKANLYLKNGLIVTEEGTFEGGVVVSQGKISQLVTGEAVIEAEEVVDLQGKVVERTIVRGVTVYQDGQITGSPGFGQLLRRKQPYNYFSITGDIK